MEKTATTYSYGVESYAWIDNLGKSVLKLNSVIAPYGFEFIRVRLDELDQKFSDFFGLSPEHKSGATCTMSHCDAEVPPNGSLKETIELDKADKLSRGIPIEEIETTISVELHELLQHSVYNGFGILMEREVVLLKRISNFERMVTNNTVTINEIIPVHNELDKFVKALIHHLRLLKNGDVNCSSIFQVATESRKIIQRFKPRFTAGTQQKFEVDEDDVVKFQERFSTSFEVNSLTELALSSFNLSYEIQDMKSKYLTLMICLESLFNLGKDQISHTISRHLSILISDNREIFQTNYNRIKKLYGFRSKIVHGQKLDENILGITSELQNLVRQAINYCLSINKSREEFFHFLNSKGFNE